MDQTKEETLQLQNKLIYKVFKSKISIQKISKLMLIHHLFVPKWRAEGLFKYHTREKRGKTNQIDCFPCATYQCRVRIVKIVVAFLGNEPISWALETLNNQTWRFTKRKYRRRGIQRMRHFSDSFSAMYESGDNESVVKSRAEIVFEQYLAGHGMEWEYETLPGRKKPDYLIPHAGGKCIVKHLLLVLKRRRGI